MTAAPALGVRGLTKRFGAVTAIGGIDLDVPAGAFVGLIGPSGCGKTTVLRLLAGLERADAGTITADGRDLAAAAPSERGMGMVFQSYALFPNMTVAANVAFGMARNASAAERGRRVDELLETVGLAGYGARRPGQLSGGQQQRVAMARALAPGPRVLLLDEPLSALDPQIREQLRGELKALQRRLGVTTLMVTHDQAEALAICDEIVVLRRGRVEQTGSPRTIYERPANLFVAGFVGAMNQWPGVVDTRGQVRLAGGAVVDADTNVFTAGAQVTAAVRPEAIETTEAGAGDFDVEISGLEFAGAFARLSGRISNGGPPILIDAPAAAGLALVGRAVGARIAGDRVRLFPAGAA